MRAKRSLRHPWKVPYKPSWDLSCGEMGESWGQKAPMEEEERQLGTASRKKLVIRLCASGRWKPGLLYVCVPWTGWVLEHSRCSMSAELNRNHWTERIWKPPRTGVNARGNRTILLPEHQTDAGNTESQSRALLGSFMRWVISNLLIIKYGMFWMMCSFTD